MATISAGDATKLRYPYVRRTNTTLNIAELEEIATAEIDTFTATYPRASYPVKNTAGAVTWDTIGAGNYVHIESPAGVVKFDGILRLGNDASNVYIQGHVQGDTGLAKETAVSIAVDDVVTIYRQKIPQTFLSRIDGDGILYKRWSREFSTGSPQTNRPKPQVNFGGDKQYRVAAGGTETGIVLDASDSFSYLGNSITYEWVLPTGVTITTGTTTDASITVSIDEGQHRIRCRVTDSGTSTSLSGDRWYYINSTNEPAFSDSYNVESIGNFSLTREGWQATFTVSADTDGIPSSRLYTGAPVLLTYDIEYSADGETWVTTDDADCKRREFKGYIHNFNEVSYNRVGRIDRVTFTVKSLLLYSDDIPVASQAIQYSATPANWQQSSYTDIGNLFVILTTFHNDVITEDDDVFIYTDMTLETPLHAINFGSMGAAMREIARKRLGGNLGNVSSGAMHMRPHRSYEDDSWRSAQTPRFTFTNADHTADSVAYQMDEKMRYWQTDGAFFVSGTSGNAVRGIRGLGAPMQGASLNQTRGFVAESESDGLLRIGHDHQNKNRRLQQVTLSSVNDGLVEPALLDAYTLSLNALDALDKGVWNDTEYIPIEARYTFPANVMSSIPPRIDIDFEPETKGLPATKVTAKPIGQAQLIVTFDTGGYSEYTVGASENFTDSPDNSPGSQAPAVWMSAAVAAVGNPGNAAQGTGTYVTSSGSDTLYTYVDFLTDRNISGVTVDLYAESDDWNSGSAGVSWNIRFMDSSWATVTGTSIASHNESGTGAGTVGANGEWITPTYSGTPTGVRYMVIFGQADGFTNGVSSVDVRIDNISITLA